MLRRQRVAFAATALGGLITLAGCAVEFSNPRPARDIAQAARPPGTLYVGWRVYQDRCARCHGPSGNGSAEAPDLLLSLHAMGPRRFVDAVLRRYDWRWPADDNPAAREQRFDEVMARRRGELQMPDWQGEPQVTAHIADLYAYLSARADGTQGPDRPAP